MVETLEQIGLAIGAKIEVSERSITVRFPTQFMNCNPNALLARLRPFTKSKELILRGPSTSESEIILKK